jgi:hypothetical protein
MRWVFDVYGEQSLDALADVVGDEFEKIWDGRTRR